MAEGKSWCWEAAARGYGPDWLFVGRVAPEAEGDLERIAGGIAPPGFTGIAVRPEHCRHHGQVCSVHTFVDTASAEAYRRNISGEDSQNLWLYDVIQLHRDRIEIERGYGGRGDTCAEVETAFLLRICAAPAVTLRSWTILAGGDGYEHRVVREGSDLASLMAYLAIA